MAKGFGDMIKQAQRLQKQMLEVQEDLGNRTVEGTAGGGMVTATVNGRQELLSIKIDPEVVDPDDVELLEDLIVAAVTNAAESAKATMQTEMGKLMPGGMGGKGFPGM